MRKRKSEKEKDESDTKKKAEKEARATKEKQEEEKKRKQTEKEKALYIAKTRKDCLIWINGMNRDIQDRFFELKTTHNVVCDHLRFNGDRLGNIYDFYRRLTGKLGYVEIISIVFSTFQALRICCLKETALVLEELPK